MPFTVTLLVGAVTALVASANTLSFCLEALAPTGAGFLAQTPEHSLATAPRQPTGHLPQGERLTIGHILKGHKVPRAGRHHILTEAPAEAAVFCPDYVAVPVCTSLKQSNTAVSSLSKYATPLNNAQLALICMVEQVSIYVLCIGN